MNELMIIFIFLFGTILGSFYGVLGTRLPNNESIVLPASHCEFCHHELKWYELIPILSFLIQKGKCTHCQKKLPLSYLATELFTGLLFVISYIKFGINVQFFISIILSSLLIIIFVSDLKYMIILDSPLVISIILIFILKWFYFDIQNSLLALLNGFFTFLTIFAIGKLGDKLFQKESLGGGDIKLSFLFGMVLGYQMSLIAFVLSTFLALPYALGCLFLNKNHVVPFGPFLASSLWFVFFFYEKFETIIPFLLNI